MTRRTFSLRSCLAALTDALARAEREDLVLLDAVRGAVRLDSSLDDAEVRAARDDGRALPVARPDGFWEWQMRRDFVRSIRSVESALGDGQKRPAPSERATAAVARKSLVAARDIAAGTVVTDEMIALSRPGTGLPPSARALIVGRIAGVDITDGTLLSTELVR